MTPHKFNRVDVTQEMIDTKINGLHPFVHKPGVYVEILDGAGKPWLMNEHKHDPGNSCIIICPHCNSEYVNNSAYADARDFCPYCKQERVRHVQTAKHADISGGLGIGGAGSDDYNIHTETDSFAPQFSSHKSSGQLWQPCDRRGCDNEPVCLDCEYCDDHCHCGE